MNNDSLGNSYPKDEIKTWFRNVICDWSKTYFRDFPWRHTQDPYLIFIAEILLQQTDAPRVVPVYERLTRDYPSIKLLSEASLSDLEDTLKPLGFHYRASRLFQSAKIIVNDSEMDGEIPDDRTLLLKLPGIGPYVANSILANAFNQPLAVIDTNISRILQRFFGIQSQNPRPRNDPKLWSFAQEIAPVTEVSNWNLTLIDFGTAVCTSRSPKCAKCPLFENCNYASISAIDGK